MRNAMWRIRLSTGRSSTPRTGWLRSGLMSTLAIGALVWTVVPVGLSASDDDGWPVDPCQPLFASPVDQLALDLRGGPIGDDLVAQFPAINFTCSATNSDGISRVRGVFSELADDAGTVALVIALGPLENESEYRRYLGETFQEMTIQFEFTDLKTRRGLIGWVVEHTRVEEARRLHHESIQHVNLSDLARGLTKETH